MSDINIFDEVKECTYKNEHYSVRDNGAVYRHRREDMPKRPLDEIWTFGKYNLNNGYADIAGVKVHRIVATAFLGNPENDQLIVDHIDTNRRNNRPENLRWLTKLENILLNDFTKKKIIYICGSVEAFLENPSLLSGHESEDPNFGWMRAVSKDEALRTRINLNRILSSPSSRSTIGKGFDESIFDGDSTEGFSNKDYSSFCFTEPASVHAVNNEPCDSGTQCVEVLEERPKATPFSQIRKEIVNLILELSEQKGWSAKRNYKTEGWKADIIVSHNEKKIAFNITTKEQGFEASLRAMERDGVCGCWLSSHKRFCPFEEDLRFPLFSFHFGQNGYYVDNRGLNNINIVDFVDAFVSGCISFKDKFTIEYFSVFIDEEMCWKCNNKMSVYNVVKLVDKDGTVLNGADLHDIPIDFSFQPKIIESVMQFSSSRPELGFCFGEIKERHSNTMGHSYPSFGCPNCDSIWGDHYRSEFILDTTDLDMPEKTHTIHLDDESLVFDIPHWCLKNQ